MNKAFIILIVITQINYLYLSPVHPSKNKNLKKSSKIKEDRKLDDLSDDNVIIHLNDVHCGLNDTIGYDGFVLYRDELKKKYKHVITADVGDHIQGGTLGAISQGTAILKLMNKIKFDVNLIGNHEFDYGIEQLDQLNENMTTKYICSNFHETGKDEPYFDPYKIVEAGNKKIAFIGALTPLTYSKTYLSTLLDDNGKPLYDFYADHDSLASIVQKYVDEVRGNGVDYVILLTHIGMDVEEYTSNDLVSRIQNVDAVLDGHTHIVYAKTSKDKNGKDVYFTQTGTKLANIGQLIIKPDGTIENSNIAAVPEPSDTTGAKKVTRGKVETWVNTEMSDFIDGLWDEYADELNIDVGEVDFDLKVFPEGITDSHASYCRKQECSLGNLCADSFKSVVQSDVSFINGGSIRTDLKKGKISRKHIIDVFPFFNSVFVKEVDGQAILDALELGVSKLPSASGGFPQVSGITFDVDTSFNSTVVTDSNGVFQEVTGKRRVSNVKINGQDLVKDKKYNLSCSSYIAEGGDGYSMFAKFQSVNESIFTDSDSLSHHIKYNLKGKIPEDYNKEESTRIFIDKPSSETTDNGGNNNNGNDNNANDNADDDNRQITRIKLNGEYLKKYGILSFLLLFVLF